MKLLTQTNDYNCGVFSLYYLLYLNDIKVDINQLEIDLGTNPEDGTSHKQIIDWFKNNHIINISYGYNKNIYSNRLITPCIVNYQLVDEDSSDGHYSVVLCVTNHNIILYDPSIGEIVKINKDLFVSRWYSERYGIKWYLRIT